MAPIELAELEIQLQKLLDRIYTAKQLALESPCIICEEKGWHISVVYRL